MAKRRLLRALGGGVHALGQSIMADRKEAALRQRQAEDDERTATRMREAAALARQNQLQDKGLELLLRPEGIDPDIAPVLGKHLNFDLTPNISSEAKRAMPILDLIAAAKRGEALGDQNIRARMAAAKIPVDTGLPGGAEDEGPPRETTYRTLLDQDKARQTALEGQHIQEQLENIAEKRSEAEITSQYGVSDFVQEGPGGRTFRRPMLNKDIMGKEFNVPTTTPNMQILSAPMAGPGGARGTGFFTAQGALGGVPSAFVPEPMPAGQLTEAQSVEKAVDTVFDIEDALPAAEGKLLLGLGPWRGTLSEAYNRYAAKGLGGDDPDVASLFSSLTALSNAMARPEIGSARTGVELAEISKMLPGGDIPINTLKTRLKLAQQKALSAINFYRRLEGRAPLSIQQYKLLREVRKLNQAQ